MLSENLYTLRRQRGLSQEQLAERIGVSRQAISKWETGLSAPELDKLKALSEFFQVTMDDLTGSRPLSPAAHGEEPEPAPLNRGTVPAVRTGALLCLLGALGMLLFGALLIVHPAAADQLNASSAITLNGTGILITLCLLLMTAGVVLILKKK